MDLRLSNTCQSGAETEQVVFTVSLVTAVLSCVFQIIGSLLEESIHMPQSFW